MQVPPEPPSLVRYESPVRLSSWRALGRFLLFIKISMYNLGRVVSPV
jgi:hypothetical protein